MIIEKLEKNKKLFYMLLLVFSLSLFSLTGCGGDKAEEEVVEEAPAPVKRKARAPRKKTARKKKPSRSRNSRKGKSDGPEQIQRIQKKALPKDRLIEFEFDPETIGKKEDIETKYPGKTKRRNIFRDIKSSNKLRNEADLAIKQAEEMIEQVESLPEGARSEIVLKKAKENLKKAQGALKSNNFLLAKELANLSKKLAHDSMNLGDGEKEDLKAEMKYNGAFMDNNHWTAIITKIDAQTKREVLFMKAVGEVIVDSQIDPETGRPLTYRVEDIFEDYIVMRDMLKNKRFNLIMAMDYKKRLNRTIDEKKSMLDSKFKKSGGNTSKTKKKTTKKK